jgi:peptidoglycan/xylan/chitin deacetylase (PgdA/CDA1 family)/GT2 family glycosyltransferase
MPKISVIIPARNAARTLAQTFESLIAQTVSDWEALVVDDGSSDETGAIIARYAAADQRFKFLAGPGQGVSAARNTALAEARGKFLHFLDADDWTEPHAFETLLAALGKNPDAVVAYCGYRRVLPDGRVTPPQNQPEVGDDPLEAFARSCAVAIHAVLVEREIVLRIGGFDTSLRNAEDWDLWQRIARFGGRWVYVDDPMALYRTSEASLSQNISSLLANSRQVIDRGFGVDERLAALAPVRAEGASEAQGSRALAQAHSALWLAGTDCGAGGDGRFDGALLLAIEAPRYEVDLIAHLMFDGLLVGARGLAADMAAYWPRYGAGLTSCITWFGEVWNDPVVARAIQYTIERMILDQDKLPEPRPLSLTLGLRVDMADLRDTVLPPGVDWLYVLLTAGGKPVTRLHIAALGTITAAEWAEILVTGREPNDRNFKFLRRPSLRPDEMRHVAMEYARDLRWYVRRRRFRKAKAKLVQAAAGVPAPSGHTARLAAMAAAAAARAEQAGFVRPARKDVRATDEGVDPANRATHFEEFFDVEDPWNYSSAYEQQKYRRQIELLPPGKIGRALELACAEGHFTVMLAPYVEHLLATDIAAKALERTKKRCAALDNIEYLKLDFAADPIPGGMDLIVCSETLYYLTGVKELRAVAAKIAGALAPGGVLVTAHARLLKDNMAHTGFDWDSIYGGEVIRGVLAATPGLALEHSIEAPLYIVDRFRRVEPGAARPEHVVETAEMVTALDRDVARFVVWGGAAMRRSDAARERRKRLPVLMYHAVAEDGPAGLARYRLTPEQFRAQMRWLRANGFHTIGSGELAARIRDRRPLRGRPVILSFDDGMQNFADHAWPILLAHDFTAEMFVVTDLVGKAAIWDADLGPPTPLMDAETIARLAAEGVLFGSHLATHRAIHGLSSAELFAELAGSRAMLESWTGEAPVSFAAPFSIVDDRLQGLAAAAGYRVGYGNKTGLAALGMTALDLPRIEVRGDETLEDFIRLMQASL